MNLPLNLFDGDVDVRVFLCQPDKTIIGEILFYESNANFKFNTYSEISFTIDRHYNDLLDGKTKVNPYYDLVESLRVIYLQGIGHFSIQDVDEDISDNESKSVTCFSIEYTTGQKYLENFYVNTGEEGSIETMYHAQQYGAEYSIDNYYREVTMGDSFDPYERYYIKEYSSTNAYNYVEAQITDENDFNNYDETLYIKKYPNVRFYWPTKPELSLLHHIFDRIPEWKIGHVDRELYHQERTFSEDRIAVYDFLYNQAAETLKYVMVWDSINGVVNFYQTTEDGITADNEVETQWNTDVFISKDNLASAIDIKYSADDIKTKLKITGSDTLDVRDVNLGQNYILDLSYYIPESTPSEWVGWKLQDRYNDYVEELAKYTEQYKELISAWSAAYNEYTDLMNHVPVEPRVMLIGDVFEKLYCIKNPYIPAPKEFDDEVIYDKYYKYDSKTLKYYEVSTPTAEQLKNEQYYVVPLIAPIDTIELRVKQLVQQLRTKLGLYDVDRDSNGKMSSIALTDDVLLTLENEESNSATIRIRYNQDIKGLAYCKVTNDDIINKTNFTLYVDSTSGAEINTTNVKDLADGDLYVASNYVFKYNDSKKAFIVTDEPVYLIYRTLTNATNGVSNTLSYTLTEWVSGELLSNKMGLDDSNEDKSNTWKIKSIGTLGAYFCLARDETEKTNLEDYGIRLLEEKKDTYTKIFITQTEGYMNKEGSQCITSNELPTGNEYPDGTKWLDTDAVDDDGKLIMKIRSNGVWIDYTPDDNDYENYARFNENYTKLGNVQAVLAEKQLVADYLLNGVAVTGLRLTDKDIDSNTLLNAARYHFLNDTITLSEYNAQFGFITFTVASDTNNKYAVYVNNGIPYVSYAHSQGLCLAKMNKISQITDMNTFFTKEEIIALSPYIREDEYSDDNFLLTGYESEEEQMNIKQELLKAGDEELKKLRQPKLSFSATMANILSIPEFAPLKYQFKLGNFIRVGIREGYVKRARLLEVQISFDNPSDFSATFGDLISTKSEIDKHADLLQQAVTAGKSVAANQGSWQRAVDKSTELDRRITDGLKDAALSVGAAQGQAITWDSNGIWGRKLVDGTTDQYEPEQFRLINNKLVFSSDGFKTSKAVFGKYTVNGETRWGPLAEYITADMIEGKTLKGGSIQIGDEAKGNLFIVNTDGSVQIKTGGQDKYASVDAITEIDSAYKYTIQILHTGKAVFSSKDDKAIMTAQIFRRGVNATAVFKSAGVIVNWEKNPSDANWTPVYTIAGDSYSITLDSNNIQNSAQISCYIEPTEAQINAIESNYND